MTTDGLPPNVIQIPLKEPIAPRPTLPGWVPPIDTGQPSAQDLNELGTAPKATFAAANSVVPIVYGRDRLFGKVFVAHVDEAAGFLYLAFGFCQGEIQGFETVYIDGIDVNEATTGFLANAGAVVELHTGAAGQATSTLLSGALGSYADTCDDLAYIVIKAPQGSTQGFPRCEAVVQGRKVYDPRGDSTRTDIDPVGSGAQREDDVATWVYSTNPTICFRDLVTNFSRWGILDQGVADLATHNDVPIMSVKRREIGLTLAQPSLIEKWVTGFRTYMGAFLGWEEGKIRVVPNRLEVDAQGGAIFDGSVSTEIDMGTDAVLDMGATQNFTLEFKFNTVTSGAIQVLGGKKAQTGTGAGYVIFLDASGDLQGQVQDTGAVATASETTGTYDDNQWHHVAITVDRTSDELILYADGVAGTPVDISALTLTLANANNFALAANGAVGQRFTGQIDEVRLWDDVRTPTEILENIAREIPLPETEPNLVGYWRLNDGVGADTAVDSSVNSNDGTAAGAAEFGFGDAQIIPENVAAHFTADDIVKDSMRLTRRSLRSVPNSVAVDYEDSSGARWFTSRVQADSPRVTSGAEARRLSRISLPGIHNASQAQREATERLNWYLTDLEARITVFDEGWCLQTGSIVAVTHPIGLNAKLFRVRGLTALSGRWTLDLVEYDPAIYSNEVITNPTTPDTNLGNPLNPPTVSGLTLVEELFNYKSGITGSRVRITFDQTTFPFFSQYLIEGYVDGTKVFQITTQSNEVVTPGVEELVSDAAVIYEVRVSVQSPFSTGLETTETVEILGKLAVPGDVPNIYATQVGAGEVAVSWEDAIDIDIWRYELRQGDPTTNNTWELATRTDLMDDKDRVFVALATGSYRWFVKAIDSVRNESENAVFVDITLAPPPAVLSVFGFEIASEVRLNWPAPTTGFVERYRIAYDTVPPSDEITLDVVDTLRFQTKDVPEGTWRFLVYAQDKLGNEATTAPFIDIEVTSDADAFLADTYDFVTPTLTNMVEYDLRLDPRQLYVTNMGDVLLSSPSDFNTFSAEPLANYHSVGASEWLSETKDFGTLLTGNWLLTHDVTALTGVTEVALELSVAGFGTDSTTFLGTTVKGAYQYARVRVSTYNPPGTSTAFVKSPVMSLKISVIPLEESGSSTSVATEGVGKTIVLSREYTAVKEINVQPKNVADALMGVVDNIVVGPNTAVLGDGTNYLDAGDVLDLGTGNFTAEFWVSNSSGSSYKGLFNKSDGSIGVRVALIEGGGNNNIRIIFADGTNTVTLNTSSQSIPDDGEMHHVAIGVDRGAADDIEVIIDGVEDANSPFSISTVTGTLDNATSLKISSDYNGTLPFAGKINDFRLWDDLRTPTEITDNKDSPLDMTITHANLVGYWLMDGPPSTTVGTVQDETTNNNDLTSTGAGTLTYADPGLTSPLLKSNSFDVYVFDIFGQQLAIDFQWNWKAV